MSAEQLTPPVAGSSWEDVGDEIEGKLTKTKKGLKKSKKKKEPKNSTLADAGGVVVPEPNSPLSDSAGGDLESKIITSDVAVLEPIVSEPVLDSAETEDVRIGQMNMDEVLEKKSQKEEEKEKMEIQAEKELRVRLARVFPEKGEGGNTVSQDVLIEKFLKSHPDSHKFIMYGRDGHLAKEIFSFFRGSSFSNLLGLKDFQDKENAKKQAREYLIEHGINLWENSARKNSESGTEKMFDDLEGIRNNKDVPNVVEPTKVDSEGDAQGDIITLDSPIPLTGDFISHEKVSKQQKIRTPLDIDGEFEVIKETSSKVALKEDENERDKKEADVPEILDFQEKNKGSGIVKSAEVVGEAVPEIAVEEEMKSPELQEKKEGVSLEELRNRVEALKKTADEARDTYFSSKYRNEQKWRGLKKYFSFLRSKELPESVAQELEKLEKDWGYALTVYKDARLELVKSEMADEVSSGRKSIGDVNAEAFFELESRNKIETRDAWMSASFREKNGKEWYDRVESRLGVIGEWYRNLPWQERIAITAGIAGAGIAGAVVGSGAVVTAALLADITRRGLGAYVAKVGLSHGAEAWNRKQNIGYNEAALENVRKIEDKHFLEENKRMQKYAEIRQKEFEQMANEHLKREQAGAIAGLLLFGAGTAYAYRDAIKETATAVSKGFGQLLQQMKIITGLEDFHGAPVSIAGAVEEVANTANLKSEISSVVNAPLTIEGTEAVGKIAGESVKMLSIEAGSSIEGAMIKSGIDPGDTHRAFLAFLKEMKDGGYPKMESMEKVLQGKMMPGDRVFVVPTGNAETPIRIVGIDRMADKFSVLQPIHAPGTEAIWKELSDMPSVPDTSLTTPPDMFGDVRPDVLPNQAVARAVLEGNAIEAASAHPEPIPPTPETVSVPSSSPEPPDAFDRYGTAAKVIPSVAGLAAAGIAGKITYDGIKLDKEKKNLQEVNFQRFFSFKEVREGAHKSLKKIQPFYSSFDSTQIEKFPQVREEICNILFDSSEANLKKQNGFFEKPFRDVIGLGREFLALQLLFEGTGEKFPWEILFRSSGEALDLITKRFLTGKLPEEFRGSAT